MFLGMTFLSRKHIEHIIARTYEPSSTIIKTRQNQKKTCFDMFRMVPYRAIMASLNHHPLPSLRTPTKRLRGSRTHRPTWPRVGTAQGTRAPSPWGGDASNMQPYGDLTVLYIDIYIYKYTHIHTYIHTYVHTYITLHYITLHDMT